MVFQWSFRTQTITIGCFLHKLTIVFDVFFMVFKNSRPMVSNGPSLQSTVEVIYESYEVMTKTWVHGDEVSNGWVHWDGGAHEVEDVLLLGDGVLNALHLGHSMITDS